MSRDSFWSEFIGREASGIKEREKEEGGSGRGRGTDRENVREGGERG